MIEELIKESTFTVPDPESGEMLILDYENFLEYLIVTNQVMYYSFEGKGGAFIMPQKEYWIN